MSPEILDTAGSPGSSSMVNDQPVTRSSESASPVKSFKFCNSTSALKTASHSESTQSSALSQRSSDEYGGVPYEEFEVQVQKLCQLLWPTPTVEARKPSATRKRRRFLKALRKRDSTLLKISYKPKQFIIEQMQGGGYNSVLGITIIGQNDEIDARMVLRVPRMGVSPSDQDVTNLQFVQEYLNLPTAEIIAYDFSDHNPLSSPYCIQSRISGHDLESEKQSYPSLSHKQKLAFVEEFCETVLLGLPFVQYPWIGQINKGKDGYTVRPFEIFQENKKLVTERAAQRAFFKARPLGPEELTSPQDPKDRLHVQSILHFFEVQFGRHRNIEHHSADLDPSTQWEETIWHRLVRAAKQMYDFGCLDCEYYCLTHYDLDPRNIMVEIQDGNPQITGIIDWDLACFAPDWVGCKPPMWIWNWLDGGSEDESRANDEDTLTAEQKELKALFDGLVGFDYRYYAYEPHYRLARAMFKFARFGLPNEELRIEAQRVCEEWEVMYREKQAVWEERERVKANDGVDDVTSEQGGGDQNGTEIGGMV